MKHLNLAAVFLAACITPLQTVTAADSDNAIWGIVSTSDKIRRAGTDTRWRYSIATQWRNFDRGNGADQYLLRSSMGYDVKPGMTLWAGFDYFQTDPDGGSKRFERRYWQQFSWAARRFDWGSLAFRWRFEQRDLENSRDTGLRFRQQAQLAFPLEKSDMTAIVSMEHFANLNDTDAGARSGFDQLRSYAGLRLPLNKKASLEGGYMHQFVNRATGVDAVNHTLMLHLRVRFR
ncbi:MAG: DUF2490 domain-containing protein [Woeseia sp.]